MEYELHGIFMSSAFFAVLRIRDLAQQAWQKKEREKEREIRGIVKR